MSYQNRIVEGESNSPFTNIKIKGTDLSVSYVLRRMSEGVTIEELLIEYSELKIEDVLASLKFASEVLSAMTYKNSLSLISKSVKKSKEAANKLRAYADDIRSGKTSLPSFMFPNEDSNSS